MFQPSHRRHDNESHGNRRHGHCPRAGGRRSVVGVDAVAAAGADGGEKDATERGTEQTVDDEVAGRVNDAQLAQNRRNQTCCKYSSTKYYISLVGTGCGTNPQPIEVVELEHYGRRMCSKPYASSHDASTVVSVANKLDCR